MLRLAAVGGYEAATSCRLLGCLLTKQRQLRLLHLRRPGPPNGVFVMYFLATSTRPRGGRAASLCYPPPHRARGTQSLDPTQRGVCRITKLLIVAFASLIHCLVWLVRFLRRCVSCVGGRPVWESPLLHRWGRSNGNQIWGQSCHPKPGWAG